MATEKKKMRQLQQQSDLLQQITTPAIPHPHHYTQSTMYTSRQLICLSLLILLSLVTLSSFFLPVVDASRTAMHPIPIRARTTTTTTKQNAAANAKSTPNKVAPRATDAMIDAHVSIQQVLLDPPADFTVDNRTAPILSFEVAMFTVHLNRHFSPVRTHTLQKGSNSSEQAPVGLDESDFFPEEYESIAHGLTRLACGGENTLHARTHHSHLQFFDSFPEGVESLGQLKRHHQSRKAKHSHLHSFKPHEEGFNTQLHEGHIPELYLLPLDSPDIFSRRQRNDYVHPLYELLHPLLGSAPEVVAGGTRLRYALLMNMEWIAQENAEGAPIEVQKPLPHFAALTEEELLSCSLHFLPEHLQTLQPVGHYVDTKGKVLRGSIGFTPAPHAEPLTMDPEDVETVFEVARKILPFELSIDEQTIHALEAQQLALETAENLFPSFDPSLVQKVGNSADAAAQAQDGSTPVSEISFLATEEHMMFFGELAKSLTTAILQPIAATVGGVLNGVFFDQTKEKLFQTQEGDLANEIPNQLIRAEIGPTTYEIVKKIGDTVNGAYPDMLAESLVEAVTPTITESLTTIITEKSTAQLARSNPFKIGKPLVEMMIPEILLPLGHILTKSLSIGLTPTILHTLDATPHMDYYCWFCSTKQIYCGFCSYAPKQIYYANYYAGYYSTYYSNYYTRYAVDAFQLQRNPLDYTHKTQYLSMPDDSFEIVIPMDETMSTWKEEERRKGTQHFSLVLRPQHKE